MTALLRWLEATAFNDWIAESAPLVVFPGILAAHTIGLGLVAGLNGALDLRLLGVARDMPPSAFLRFLGVMHLGLWLNVISGVALVLVFPTKALTNPVFYLKLAMIAAALLVLRVILHRVRTGDLGSRNTRLLAGASLFFWAAAISAGRLLAYRRLLFDAGGA